MEHGPIETLNQVDSWSTLVEGDEQQDWLTRQAVSRLIIICL